MTGLGTITAWIVAQRNSTPMPTAGTSSLTLHPNTRIQTAMATVITTPTPFTAITVPLLTANPIGTETVALTATATVPATRPMRGPSLSGTSPKAPMFGPSTPHSGRTPMAMGTAITPLKTQQTPTSSRFERQPPTTRTTTAMRIIGQRSTTAPTRRASKSMPAQPNGATQAAEAYRFLPLVARTLMATVTPIPTCTILTRIPVCESTSLATPSRTNQRNPETGTVTGLATIQRALRVTYVPKKSAF